MQEQPLPQTEEAKKEHRFLPRFIGLIAGAIGGIFTGTTLRNMSHNDFIRRGLVQVEHPENPGEMKYADSYVIHVWEKIKAVLNISEDLKKLPPGESVITILGTTKNLTPEQRILLKDIDPAKIPLERWEQADKQFRAAAEKLKSLWDEAKKVAEKITGNHAKQQREIANAENNYWRGIQIAREKAFHPEMAKELQYMFRHSPHKKWIFASSAVALCAVGYAAYKITDRLMNGKEKKSYQQTITDRRTTTNNGEAAGTTVA